MGGRHAPERKIEKERVAHPLLPVLAYIASQRNAFAVLFRHLGPHHVGGRGIRYERVAVLG